MTDRELLELAAKAAGMPKHVDGMGFETAHQPKWNPLTDDGDAFLLMIDLDIGVHHGWTYADEKVPYANVCAQHIPSMIEVGEIKGDDPAAATRRAIVRAAAEIGKRKEKNA